MNHCFRCFSIVLFFFLSCMSYLFGQEQTLSTVDTGYELWMNYKPLPESGTSDKLASLQGVLKRIDDGTRLPSASDRKLGFA